MTQVNLVSNIGLDDTATGVQTGSINEPTAAALVDELFVTGNWFASRSADGGTTWSLVDPFTTFPEEPGGFCCDQIVLHEPSRNLWIWILQYIQQGGSNVFRLAISASGVPDSWTFWDFSPGLIDAAWETNAWFDYPDAATSDDSLYVTFNVFDTASPANWLGAVVFRLPLDGLVSGDLEYEFLPVTTHGSLRLTRGATSDMYFASHNGQNPVRIFRWPDQSNATISSFEVSASDWSGQTPYSSPGPGGAEWLGRVDPRITGGWVVGNEVGFLWTANSGPGRPQPYVKALIADTDVQSLVSEPDIWNESAACAYAAACPNVDGVVGVSLFFGGGGKSHPGHVVGFMDGGEWVLAGSSDSTDGPAGGSWGDYVSCAVHEPNGNEWVASGYTLQGGADRESIEPRYVRFAIEP